jgi:AcrR family transcriptional regulator
MSADVDAVRRRPGGRSARVREAVLEATIEAIADGGYAGLTIDGVARRAGVHKTTVYRRWETREALVLDALLARSASQVVVPDTGSLRGDLVALLRSIAANITSREGRALVVALLLETRGIAGFEDLRQQFWATRFELVTAVIEHAIARGELDPTTDADLFVELAIAPLYLRVLVTGEEIDDAFVIAVTDHVITGAGASSTPLTDP